MRWLQRAEPDVVCLQELEAEQRVFSKSALRALGYRAVWEGQRSWNGVAILARDHEPVLTRSTLQGDADDHQARYIEAVVNGVIVGCLYLPNGNPQPGPKFDYKLAWFDRLLAHAAELMKAGVPVVLVGRLQRRSDGSRHLSHTISGSQRVGAACEPCGVCAASRTRLNRYFAALASAGTTLDILGL